VTQCALCFKSKPLRNSHILPEFLYTSLYDHLHRFEVFSSDPSKRRLHVQKGLREKLLCGDCEQQLSKHERYASLFFSGDLPGIRSTRKGDVVEIEGLDYEQFKLFGLSVLWRAGVSRHAMFQKVELGPHEEKLRQMVHAGCPGEPEDYGFFLTILVHDNKVLSDLMVNPTRARLHGRICYRFVFGGLVWLFTVTNFLPANPMRDAFLSRQGKMLMLVNEFKNIRFLMDAAAGVLGSYKDRNAF